MKALAISIAFSLILIAGLAVFGLNYYLNSTKTAVNTANKSGANLQDTSDPTKLALDVKTQTDLKAIQTGLSIYYAENSYYPFSLQELIDNNSLSSIEVNSFSYTRCDADTIVVAKSGNGFKLDGGNQTTELTC